MGRLRLDKNSRLVYPRKDILKNGCPDLWSDLDYCFDTLIKWQETIIQILPSQKKQLSCFPDVANDVTNQLSMLGYIHLRSLYAFAKETSTIIKRLCIELAESSFHKESEKADKWVNDLNSILHIVKEFRFDDIANDQLTGFMRLNTYKERIQKQMDFPMFASWTFRDVVGVVLQTGILNEQLWKDALECEDLTSPNVVKLSNDSELDELIR